jgi:hypothetical protein
MRIHEIFSNQKKVSKHRRLNLKTRRFFEKTRRFLYLALPKTFLLSDTPSSRIDSPGIFLIFF